MKKQEILFGSWLYALNVSRKEIISQCLDANVFRILTDGNETATYYLKRCWTPHTVGNAEVFEFKFKEQDLREIELHRVSRLGLFAILDESIFQFEVAILSIDELKACIGPDSTNSAHLKLKISGGCEFRIFGNALPEVSAIAIPRNRIGGDMNGGLKSKIIGFDHPTRHEAPITLPTEGGQHELGTLGGEPFTVSDVAEALGLSVPGARIRVQSWLNAGLIKGQARRCLGRGRPTVFYVGQRRIAA